LTEEKVTLIVMHSPKSPPKSISVTRRRVMFVVGFLMVFLGFSVFSGLQTFTNVINRERYSELERENEVLKHELAQIQDKVTTLQYDMAGHAEFEERLRVLADLEPMDQDVWEVGVGGPELAAPAAESDRVGGALASVNSNVDRLLRQIRLQRHSFDEIRARLESKTEELGVVPSIRPVESGYVSSTFGRRRDPFSGRVNRHEGVDFSARKGSKVMATADGVVKYAGYDGAYGNTVEVDHGNGYVTRYCHNSRLSVAKGQAVRRGDVIAAVGSSGRSSGCHLHYEVLVNGSPQDPIQFILPSDVMID
jgi:murein DD-endopeptidase MepM/ murein hydrolase activator NlpD